MPPFWHPLRHPQGIQSTVILWLHHFVPTTRPPRPARSLMRNHWGPGITRQVSGLLPCLHPRKGPNSSTGLFGKNTSYLPCTQHPRQGSRHGTFIAAGGTKVLCHCAWPHSYHLSKIPISHMQNSSKGSVGRWLCSPASPLRKVGDEWASLQYPLPTDKAFLRSNTKWKTYPAEKK